MTKYNILIADDHPMARKAINSILSEDDSFTLIGEVTTGLEAVEFCKNVKPDVVLMDINMPDMDGLEATKIIKQLFPQIRVVLLTVSDAAKDLFKAIQYGSQGYLLKNMDPDDWIGYLHALLNDDEEVSEKITEQLFHQFKVRERSTPEYLNSLSEREQEILMLVALGETNRQIAEELFISENTVKNHVKNILLKLSLENRVQMTAYAVRNGLMS